MAKDNSDLINYIDGGILFAQRSCDEAEAEEHLLLERMHTHVGDEYDRAMLNDVQSKHMSDSIFLDTLKCIRNVLEGKNDVSDRKSE